MNILIACEESQRVCTEFRNLGYNAYSCDIEPCSGGHPEWHIQGDVVPVLNGNCTFVTADNRVHTINGTWDLIIAHPPCTYLTVTGNRWFDVHKYGDKARKRLKDREEAVRFFMTIANADCEHIAIENPVGIMSSRWRKPEQIIQPYMFGDSASKKTCIWLKNLPILKPTDIVDEGERVYYASGKSMPRWYADAWSLSPKERAKERSKTFPGIAKAMCEQWSAYIMKGDPND